MNSPLCPDTALDPLGHPAVTCRRGGDIVMRLDWLRDIIIDFCHSAHLGVKVEVGSRLTLDLRQTRPADVGSGLEERKTSCVGCHCSLTTYPCCAE